MKKQTFDNFDRMLIGLAILAIIVYIVSMIAVLIIYQDSNTDTLNRPKVYIPRDLPQGMHVSINPNGDTFVYQDDKIIMEMRK